MYYKSLSELSVLLGLARAGVTLTEKDSEVNKLFKEIQNGLDNVIAMHYDDILLDNFFSLDDLVGPES